MRKRLSSPRFRRRLAWTASVVVVLAAIVAGAIVVGNTGHSTQTPLSNEPAWVYHEPKMHTLSKGERLELLATSSRFVNTAVARKHLDEAWELLGPEMQAGQTRKSWNTGTNNVVPFPVSTIIAWNVAYSYENDVAFDLALRSRGGDIVGKTFTIELKRYPKLGNRWLVASWTPNGVSGAGNSKSAAAEAAAEAKRPPPKAPLSATWLMVPGAVLAVLLLTPICLAIRAVVQNRRARKRYASSYTSSSSPS
jgi:hypothetical protein